MSDVHLTANTWVPVSVISIIVSFIVAAALWASQIEAKADKAIYVQDKYESFIERRLMRIEEKLDKILEKK